MLKSFVSHYFHQTNFQSLGLLVFRVTVGLALMYHGQGKIAHAFDWMGPAMPGWAQAFAAYSEFAGGIAIALGLLTPLSALCVAGTMAGAVWLGHMSQGDPFVQTGPGGGGSYELALVYCVSAIALFFNGPGKFSVDYPLFHKLGWRQ